MKKLNFLFIAVAAGTLFFTGCEKDDGFNQKQDILPDRFSIDIPDAISHESSAKKSGEVDTLNGNEVYEHMANFIHVGEAGAEIVEDIIWGITIYRINEPMFLSFESDDDGRVKNLEVVENSLFDGVTWEFQLTIADADSESNEDGGKGIQVFWNRNPRKGIAILKPFNIDRTENPDAGNAIFRIDYSEESAYGYDAHMIVSIANLPTLPSFVDPYAMKGLKMFVGKKGDVVDVFGNSDHPNAYFFSNEIGVGFNWAFVASGSESLDIGVAEVGLPRNDLDQPSRSVLLEEYSVYSVLYDAIMEWNPELPQSLVDDYLANTEAPGYFNEDGFVSAGTSPGSQYDDLDIRLPNMSPYNPKEIRDLSISFKDE